MTRGGLRTVTLPDRRTIETRVKAALDRYVKVKFQAEDDGCNAEGGQTAATKIAANQSVVIALGSNCSSASIPAAISAQPLTL